MDMNIVIPVRKGGLGNQMFQVSAALIYKEELGKTVVLPREQKHIHRVHPNLYEDSIFKGFDLLNCSIDDLTIYSLCQNGFTVHPGEPCFEAWEPQKIEGGILLHGYFQHVALIEKHKESISNLFLSNLQQYRQKGQPTQIGIHVRRGDYLQFPDVFPLLDCSYYVRAIDTIEKRVPGPKQYKIFSEDLEWCRDQDMFQALENVEFVEEKDEIQSLCQMIACEGGFICANSSFSWWGAFLGAYQKGTPCIVPEKWSKGFTGDLIPKEWITIPDAKGDLIIFGPGTVDLHEKKGIDNIIKPLKKTVEIYIDSPNYTNSTNYKIFLHMEPLVIQVIKDLVDHILKNWKEYDKIYTFHEDVLANCPNAEKLIMPACSWISGDHFHKIDTSRKQFQISCITGSKQMAEGHTYRLLLYYNQSALINQANLPITFYRSSAGHPLPELTVNPFVQKEKFVLFENYQYSLVIENSRQTNYFTEKLIDCLITKTIPIYYGCPNIHEYFDTTGWILLTSEDHQSRIHELVQKWHEKGYTKDSYQMFSETIEKNYEVCKKKYPGYYNTYNKVFIKLDAFD